jgi:FixJ family two-component response regulator
LSAKPSRTIALVDDDDGARTAIAGLLRSLGWNVLQFASGLTFLQSKSISDITCLITDVRMPDMTGIEMHSQILAQGYVLPTIFITGFPTPDLAAKLDAPGVVAILEKPLNPDAIADCVEKACGKA